MNAKERESKMPIRVYSRVFAAQILLKMYRCLALLQLAFTAPGLLGHAVLRLDLVTSLFAVNSFSGGVTFRHRRALGKLAFGIDFFFNGGNHLFILLRREPLFFQQIFLEAVN